MEHFSFFSFFRVYVDIQFHLSFFLFSLPSFMHYNYSDSIVCLFYCLSRFFFSNNNNNNNVPSADTHLNVPSLCSTELVLENFVCMYKKEMFGFHPLSVSLSFTTDAFDSWVYVYVLASKPEKRIICMGVSHFLCTYILPENPIVFWDDEPKERRAMTKRSSEAKREK